MSRLALRPLLAPTPSALHYRAKPCCPAWWICTRMCCCTRITSAGSDQRVLPEACTGRAADTVHAGRSGHRRYSGLVPCCLCHERRHCLSKRAM